MKKAIKSERNGVKFFRKAARGNTMFWNAYWLEERVESCSWLSFAFLFWGVQNSLATPSGETMRRDIPHLSFPFSLGLQALVYSGVAWMAAIFSTVE